MQHRAAILLIDYHTVDDNQRLRIDVQRVQSLHEHHTTHTRGTVAADGIDLSAQLLLYLVLDVHGIGVFEVGGFAVAPHIHLTLILRLECRGIECHVVLHPISLDTHTDGIEVRRRHEYRCREQRHLQLVRAVILCQHTISVDTVGSDDGTGDRLMGRGVQHTSADGARLILLLLFLDNTDGGLDRFLRILLS